MKSEPSFSFRSDLWIARRRPTPSRLARCRALRASCGWCVAWKMSATAFSPCQTAAWPWRAKTRAPMSDENRSRMSRPLPFAR